MEHCDDWVGHCWVLALHWVLETQHEAPLAGQTPFPAGAGCGLLAQPPARATMATDAARVVRKFFMTFVL
ncbi:hypothetical protein DB345_06770 [Spartobacteria bacterium LR76]|nr:hypothetical protein DB345_06770 [Spartobacteria bacterium LR76]